MKVVGSATDPVKGLAEIEARRAEIDVVISDIQMPGMLGFDVCEALKKSGPSPRIIFLTYFSQPEVRFRAQRAGVDGLVPKIASVEEIVQCVRDVMAGRYVEALPSETNPESVERQILTPTEMDILRLLVCEELTSNEIAERMQRSSNTIESHRRNIMLKLDAKNVVGLVKYAVSIGLCKK
jgi:DNA-binding NarL/FixJ family response regulator